jgi:hypothetical protein
VVDGLKDEFEKTWKGSPKIRGCQEIAKPQPHCRGGTMPREIHCSINRPEGF